MIFVFIDYNDKKTDKISPEMSFKTDSNDLSAPESRKLSIKKRLENSQNKIHGYNDSEHKFQYDNEELDASVNKMDITNLKESFIDLNINTSSDEDILNKKDNAVDQTQSFQRASPPQPTSNNNLNINFIRRLFACGGYCGRNNRRTSGSVSTSASAYGLSKSTTAIQTKSPHNLKNNNIQNNSNTNPIKSNSAFNSQFHSELSLTDLSQQASSRNTTDLVENLKKNESYDSIIDKILSTPTKVKINSNFKSNILKISKCKVQGDQEVPQHRPNKPIPKHPRKNYPLNENLKKIESENHKIFRKTDISTDKVS